MMTVPSDFLSSTLWGVPGGVLVVEVDRERLVGLDLEGLLVEREVERDEIERRGTGRKRRGRRGVPPPAVPDQQSGTGLALGSGLKLGSRQPLNMTILPSGPITGSFVVRSLTSYSWVLGARRKLMRSWIWM